jgi:uncharacterized protein involved in exopolysaccharide biosynthesis
MNQRYVDTYRQHRRLFLLPLLIGMLFALWINLGAPSLYRSSTSLWSDTAGSARRRSRGVSRRRARSRITSARIRQRAGGPERS